MNIFCVEICGDVELLLRNIRLDASISAISDSGRLVIRKHKGAWGAPELEASEGSAAIPSRHTRGINDNDDRALQVQCDITLK